MINEGELPRPTNFGLPPPRASPVYRLEATLGEPVDLGDTERGHRRIVPLTGATFARPTLTGTLVPLDWLNKGVFVSVGGRRPSRVVYETYLVE